VAEKTAKIVLLKQDVDAFGFAQDSIKSAELVDGVSVMATDFLPDENTVQVSQDMGFLVANLSENEARKLGENPDVEAVEDDIKVYAMGGALGGQAPDEMDLRGSDLQLDDEDIEALKADPYPQFAPDEVPVSPENVLLASKLTPELGEEVEFDESGALMDFRRGALDGGLSAELAGIPREKLVALIKCVARCLGGPAGPGLDLLSDERIAEMVNAAAPAAPPAVHEVVTRGLWQIFTPYAWQYSTGAGVRVAVVDTGIATRHPDLRVWGGASFVPGVASWNDDHGHGTHVAGTIAALRNGRGVVGVAPDARLYAIKVLSQQGSGQLSWILNGLAWCASRGMHVVNLSLGSRETSHDPSVYNRAYERAGASLRRRGILLCAAAGNSNEAVGNPGRCPSFMAVSAIDYAHRKAPFSCFGRQVEICAPGVSIPSTYPSNGYKSLSGTSMATPHVSGVAALVKARYPGWHGDKIRVRLWRTARDLGAADRDPIYGFGEVRAFHAVR
jgi:subtilisin family serine protease